MSKNHNRLAWAIIEQAVFDVQELTKMGLIRKGRAVDRLGVQDLESDA